MNRPHRRIGRVTASASIVVAALLALAGCSTSGTSATTSLHDAAPAAASATATAPALPSPTPQGSMPSAGTLEPQQWPDVEVTVNSVEHGAGGLLTVVWTVTDNGKDDFDMDVKFSSSPYNYIGSGTQGLTIVDHAAKQRYYPLVSESVHCQCYRGTDSNNSGNVLAGSSQTVYDVYRPDPMPTTVDVELPGYGPAKNVKVTG